MSDTPRTDAAAMPIDRIDTIASRPCNVVHEDVCRKLERELAEAKEQRDRLAEALKGMLNVTYGQVIYNFMEPQRSAAREALAAAKGGKDE
jgi:hypothetical protein